MEGFTLNNPLGLPVDNQGQPHQLWLDAINGEGRDERLTVCAAPCGVLNGQQEYIAVFNSLTHPQQVIATRIREEGDAQHPHQVLDR